MKPLANWIAFPRKIIIYCLPWLFFNISLAYLVTQPSWQEACVQYSFRRQRPGTRRDCGTRDATQPRPTCNLFSCISRAKNDACKAETVFIQKKVHSEGFSQFSLDFYSSFREMCSFWRFFFCRSARSRGQHSRLISMSRNLIFGKTWHFISSYI